MARLTSRHLFKMRQETKEEIKRNGWPRWLLAEFAACLAVIICIPLWVGAAINEYIGIFINWFDITFPMLK